MSGPYPKAFTLIELVIVLTVLAILAALAIPVFQNIQTQARNSATHGALGGVRTAISTYLAKEIVEGRPTKLLNGNPFPSYPSMEQMRDIQDDPFALPKIMQNGDMPPNPWAFTNSGNTDRDWVGPMDPGDFRKVGPAFPSAWFYIKETGHFWANSTGNGGNKTACLTVPLCTDLFCLANPTENCY